MVTLPRPPFDDDFEAPTLKRSVPAELLDVRDEHAPAAVHASETERQRSGMRPVVSEEDIERFARREIRETIPAPPELSQAADEVAILDADDGR